MSHLIGSIMPVRNGLLYASLLNIYSSEFWLCFFIYCFQLWLIQFIYYESLSCVSVSKTPSFCWNTSFTLRNVLYSLSYKVPLCTSNLLSNLLWVMMLFIIPSMAYYCESLKGNRVISGKRWNVGILVWSSLLLHISLVLKTIFHSATPARNHTHTDSDL